MAYESICLEKDIHIEKIFTIHYFEYMNNFQFPGERHNFWEFQCVDKGEAQVETDHMTHTLTHGQIIFHKPNEFHTLRATGKSAPNIVVASFSCSSPAMRFFENRLTSLTKEERILIGMLIAEARHCIATPLDNPYTEKMELRDDPLTGSQQLLVSYLELLLIRIIRRHNSPQPGPLPVQNEAAVSTLPAYGKLLFYLEEHIRDTLTIEMICRDNLLSRTQLQKMFREQHHCGVIDYFSHMKIQLAKQLLRENQMNFTQISEYLGYSSIQYFSRQFKNLTGMTPSEYVRSIKASSER